MAGPFISPIIGRKTKSDGWPAPWIREAWERYGLKSKQQPKKETSMKEKKEETPLNKVTPKEPTLDDTPTQALQERPLLFFNPPAQYFSFGGTNVTVPPSLPLLHASDPAITPSRRVTSSLGVHTAPGGAPTTTRRRRRIGPRSTLGVA